MRSIFFSSGKAKQSGFTLLELLIVIGILAILATGIVVILNPAEILKQSRDVKRITELNSLDKALEIYSFNGGMNFGSTSTVYISIPDTSLNCNNVSSTLPVLPVNWNYNCVTSDNLRKVNGNGWVPVDFTSTNIPPLTVLPVDPLNNSDSYYSYTVGSWKIIANLESQKYKDKISNYKNISFSLCPAKVKDADNNEYLNILINGKCWMQKNLNVGTRISGASNQTNNGIIEKYCYSDSDSNCATYGGLYQWNEAMAYSLTQGVQGICPSGWHMPEDSEQYILEKYLSTESCLDTRDGASSCYPAGTILKSGGSSGFEGLLAGSRRWNGTGFDNLGIWGSFWSSSVKDGSNAWNRGLNAPTSTVYRWSDLKTYGLSIRCLKN